MVTKRPAERQTFTTQEVARRWGVNRDKVVAFIRDGQLPAMNLSLGQMPRYRIRREDLEAFEQSRMAVQAEHPRRRRRKRSTGNTVEFF